MTTDFKNEMLGNIVADLEAKIAPKTKNAYDRLVVAGMKAATHGGAGSILYALGRRDNVILTAVRGAINLVGVLKNITKGAPPPPDAMVLASFTLLMFALDFAEQAKLVEINEQTLGMAQRLFMNNVMHGSGIKPDNLQRMSNAVEAVTRNDAKMDEVRRYVGEVRDPRIPQKTLPDVAAISNEEEVANGV